MPVSFLIKLLALGCNFIKKETLAQVFSCEFCEIFKNTFFIEHLRWLLSLLFIYLFCKAQRSEKYVMDVKFLQEFSKKASSKLKKYITCIT